MKHSIYNNCIIINAKHTLLYNAFTGKFLIFKNQILLLDELCTNKPDFENGKLYQDLCDSGFLIDDKVDEVENLKKQIKEAENNDNEFILHINPTLDCNFQCWYCYENHVKKSKIDIKVLNSIKTFILSKLRTDKLLENFELGFFGGEPLLQFDNNIRPIIEFTAKECNNANVNLFVHLTSNGSLITKPIVEFLKNYNCGFQITLDGNKQLHNKTRFYKNGKGSFDTIIRNIILLAQNNIKVIVRVNYTAENIDSTRSILDSFSNIDDCLKAYMQFDFQRVWQDIEEHNDDTEIRASEIRELFRKYGFTVLTNYIPHGACDLCYGDKKNHLLINYDSYVFGCTARDFIPENSIGILKESGEIEFKKDIVERRNNSKFAKPICHNCRIAPICGGGCKQSSFENSNQEVCTLGYTEKDKDNVVLDIFDYYFCK